MVNNNFTIHIELQHYMFRNKVINNFTSEIIEKLKEWYNINVEHFFKSSHITSFDLYHIKDGIFMINFSYDTLTLPFIEDNLTNPDVFGKNPIQIGSEKYFVIGRKIDDIDDSNDCQYQNYEFDNESPFISEINIYS